jgi:hypothetical protein
VFFSSHESSKGAIAAGIRFRNSLKHRAREHRWPGRTHLPARGRQTANISLP